MARQHRIVGRLPGPSWRSTARRDFLTVPMGEVSLLRLAEDAPRSLSPYALDVARGRVLFAHTPPDVELASAHPFVYEAQRRHATRLVVATEAEVLEASRALDVPHHRAVFLYSTGRCGSTLLGKVASALDGVQALSEPDIYTQANFARDADDPRLEARLEALMQAGTRFWASHLVAWHPDRSVLFIKHRGWTLFLADLLARCIPESRALFMYRDPSEVVTSYESAFFDARWVAWVRSRRLDHHLLRLVRRSGVLPFERFLPPLDDPRCADRRAQGVVGALSLVWLALVTEAARQEAARPGTYGAPLRYEDLIASPETFARDLAVRLGVTESPEALDARAIDAVRRALEDDSQDGSSLASSRREGVDAARAKAVTDLLERFDALRNSTGGAA